MIRRVPRPVLVAVALVVGYQAAVTVAVWRAELAAARWNAYLTAAVDHADRRTDPHHRRSA